MLREQSQFRLIALTLLLGLSSVAFGQNDNHSYQPFRSSISPSQLNKILGSHNAVQEKIVSDKIAEMVLKKFKTLSPEQKQRLADLSKDFGSQSNTYDFADKKDALEQAIRNDPELRRAAEQLRSNFQQQNFDFDSTNRSAFEQNIRKQVQERLQNEIQNRSNAFENNSQTPFDFNNPSFSSDPTQPNNSKNNSAPNNSNPNNSNNFKNPFENNNFPNNNSQNNNSRPNNNTRPNNNFNSNSEPFNFPDNNSNNSSQPFEIDQQNSLNGGFSDNGQSSSNQPNSTSPSQNSASGQNDSLPNESIGHRFNRIVMNSFEKAMEKKVGGDGNGEPQSFERLMNKFVDSVTKSNPDLASNVNSGSNRFFQSITSSIRNANNRTRMSMPRFNGFRGGGGGPSFGGGGGFAMPALDIRSVVTFLLVAGMIICAIVFALKKTQLGEMLGMRPVSPKPPEPPTVPNSFQDYAEIVTLIDQFTLWLFGKKASWWNSKIVSEEVTQKSPQYSKEFVAVMEIYDRARYAESSEPVSNKMVQEIRTTLNQLKEATLAEKNNSQSLLNTELA